jgi:Ca2+-binding RTX toxin-like protein
LRVLVTATNGLGSGTKESNPTPIVASTVPTNTSLPAIQAFLDTDGTVLSYSATTGTWTGTDPITYAYQWRRCDTSGSNCQDIPAAITSTYLPAAADIGARLRVVVIATNDFGTASATSEATDVLTGDAPANSFRPSVSGTASSGSTLFALNGTWTGSTPLTFTYEWRRCNASGGACVAIPGETSSSYVVQSADVGGTIVVAVTAKNASGTATAVSSPSGVVDSGGGSTGAVSPEVRTLPSFTGALVKGRLLRANPGQWSGTTPISYKYVWQRCPATSTTCTTIKSATKQTYTLTATDVGKRIRLVVTADNSAGSDVAQSLISAKVAAKAPAGKRINGKAKAERLNGGAGPDTIHGNGGNDRISGGAGADKLYGDAGNDTIIGGAGRDSVFGGVGNDTIQANDRERDTIDCGAGRDTVTADANDVLKHCENVKR